jgi:hypothetical protein
MLATPIYLDGQQKPKGRTEGLCDLLCFFVVEMGVYIYGGMPDIYWSR